MEQERLDVKNMGSSLIVNTELDNSGSEIASENKRH